MNRRKWRRSEVIDALKYLYEIYNAAPSSPRHYFCLYSLERLLNPTRRLPSVEVIHGFWPNVRDAWRASDIRPSFSLASLKTGFTFPRTADQALRRIYTSTVRHSDRLPQLASLSLRVKIPTPALALRAVQLNLDTRNKLNWTEPELEILKSNRHLSKHSISRSLANAGYERSPQCMKIIRARRELLNSDKPSHYTPNQLRLLIGIDMKSITAWNRQGWLPFEKKGTVRTQQQGGDSYVISRTDLAHFFRTYPEMLDFRKLDQQWFVSLLEETDPLLQLQLE